MVAAYIDPQPLGNDTGWIVENVQSTYGGQTVPAPALQGAAWAQYVWNFGLYRHWHQIDSVVYGTSAYCEGYFYFWGTKPGTGSYVDYSLRIE